MIKMIYEQEEYNYGIGSQPFDIKTEIKLTNDSNVVENLVALIKLMNVAGYSINDKVLHDAIDNIYSSDYYL